MDQGCRYPNKAKAQNALIGVNHIRGLIPGLDNSLVTALISDMPEASWQ
jgi:hypothetical protein